MAENLEYRESHWYNGTALDWFAGVPGLILHPTKIFASFFIIIDE